MKDTPGDNTRPYKLIYYSLSAELNEKSHQLVSLRGISFQSKSILGMVELTIVPLKNNLEIIKLNAKQCVIYRVTVNENIEVSFQYFDPFINITQNKDIEPTLTSFSKCHLNAAQITDPDNYNGELVIRLPSDVSISINDGTSIKISVEYTLEQPSGGIHFVIPEGDGSFVERQAHMFTMCFENSSRLWFPCIDSYAEHCTWNLEFTVDENMTAVSCGDLIEVIAAPDLKCKTYYYHLSMPTCAPNIALAVGPFEIFVDPTMHNITHFCLPGLSKLLPTAAKYTHEALEFYEDTLSIGYPYSCYKQVFVDETPTDYASYASMGIMSVNLLHPKQIIDQVYVSKKILAQVMAEQFYGCFISMQNWSDWWLTCGIALYMSSLFAKKCFGNNAYREWIHNELTSLVRYEEEIGPIVLDPTQQPAPISSDLVSPGGSSNTGFSLSFNNVQNANDTSNFYFSTRSLQTISPRYFHYMTKKAHLVLRMLENRIGYSLLLQVLHNHLSLASIASLNPMSSGLWGHMLISTNIFNKTIFTVSGIDMSEFIDQWVRTGGHAKFTCTFVFNRQRNILELKIKQDAISQRGIRQYVGPLLVSIQELDGPFIHTLQVDGNETRADISCHSKVRKNKNKKILLCTGDEVNIDLNAMNNDSPVLWIRLDPEMTILRSCLIEQPEYQWIYQLRHEKDVTAQMEAVLAIDKFPTIATRNALCDIIENEQMYVHVRCKATHCLTKIANEMVNNWTGPPAMLGTFRKMFGSFSCPHIIKQNDFSNLQHYFLQKTIPIAVAGLRNSHGICPPEILKFILDLFKYNDNRKNKYSDNYYRASLIDALAATITPVISLSQNACDITADSLSGDSKLILEEITKHLNFEKRLQTYKYTITTACLKAIRKLQKFGHLPNNPNIFRSYSSYGNFIDVRLCALEALVDFTCLEGRFDDLKFLIDIVDSDPDPKVRNELVLMLCKNPPFTPKKPNNRFNNESLSRHLWKFINSLLSYDTTLRCNFVDLYYTLFEQQKTEQFRLFKPIKVEVEAESCTLPKIIVEPDNNSNGDRGIKRSFNHDEQQEISKIIDRIKIEDDTLENVLDNDLHCNKKIKKFKDEDVLKDEVKEAMHIKSSFEITESKSKTSYFSKNSASLPGVMVTNSSGPVGFEPRMFNMKPDEQSTKPVVVQRESKHHHHHRHHHHSEICGASNSSKKKKKNKRKHKHKHEHKHKQDKIKEKPKEDNTVVKVKEETLMLGSSSDDTLRDLNSSSHLLHNHGSDLMHMEHVLKQNIIHD